MFDMFEAEISILAGVRDMRCEENANRVDAMFHSRNRYLFPRMQVLVVEDLSY